MTIPLGHTLESILITDIDNHASPNKLKVAAICHLTKNSTGVLQIAHGSDPESEFGNFELFPKLFPALFPYGIGSFKHPDCKKNVSLHAHVKHLLQLTDN